MKTIMSEQQEKPNSKPNILQVIGSVLSAGLGVQSSRNRERDFKHGNHRVFIVAGILFTLLFIASIYMLVQLVLKKAGV